MSFLKFENIIFYIVSGFALVLTYGFLQGQLSWFFKSAWFVGVLTLVLRPLYIKKFPLAAGLVLWLSALTVSLCVVLIMTVASVLSEN
ncbi:hypothetical protein [Bdellovibrio sp. HCB337]|uniref:hypothetical protein n=1 Tax=Bdellovibrio sp. HCB337 TaxID=3394358 RepID=UPI0039A5144D